MVVVEEGALAYQRSLTMSDTFLAVKELKKVALKEHHGKIANKVKIEGKTNSRKTLKKIMKNILE